MAPRRDYFEELGVRPFLNAAGTYTKLTASLMPPEVREAMAYASGRYVSLEGLREAVGRRIARLIGCEAALVTAGAASAITVGTAACVTGADAARVRQLPELSGLKSDVIIQRAHRYEFDRAVRAAGARFVEVETSEELERAISPATAMMLFLNLAENLGRIGAADFVALASKHGVPAMNDAAADVPPAENLSKFTRMGFDLVAFSGGKGLRGPQSCGLLLGRRDLIEAAALNSSPNSDSIGRGMKVGKEEMLGMMVAVETYLQRDHAADWKEWEERVALIAALARSVPGVTATEWVPEIDNHVPHLRIRWDRSAIPLSVSEVMRRMREGEPSIVVNPDSADDLIIGVWMLEPGDAAIVARRLREVLLKP